MIKGVLYYGVLREHDLVSVRRIMARVSMDSILWCITIIGIPIGRQCFKFASLAFFPFGKEIRYGGGAMSTLANFLWIIISGIPLAISAALNGVLLCCTIIGIPFGMQCFKIAKLALMPFGATVLKT